MLVKPDATANVGRRDMMMVLVVGNRKEDREMIRSREWGENRTSIDVVTEGIKARSMVDGVP